MGGEAERKFGFLRGILWPISRQENRMIIPMFLMIFLICFNYSVLRNTKDALVITASAGAEVIPFIKVWAMLPAAVLLTLIFTKLSNRYSQEQVFYIIVTGFLTFYALFLFVFYPLRDFLHPNELADKLEIVLPAGCKGLVAMFRNWTFTGFYVMSELWSVMVLHVLFWGFSNEITQVGEAKRFYAVFNIGSNLAAILAGQAPSFFMGNTQEESLFLLLGTVFVFGFGAMAIFRWMNRNVLNRPEFDGLHQARVVRKQKEKLSIWECFSYVANSRYLLCIAAMVVGYNLVIHIVEVIWKNELRRLHPSFNEYNAYLGDLTTTIGLSSLVLAIMIPKLIERYGWGKTALITPVSMLVTGVSFFLILFYQESMQGNGAVIFGITPLAALVFAGAAQNISSKACKYSVFDATKEMAFIPLDHELKLKGKAAIDGVGSRLGKSGGAVLFQALILAFGSLSASAGYIAVILLVAIVAWIMAVRSLSRRFALLAKEKVEVTEPTVSRSPELSVEPA